MNTICLAEPQTTTTSHTTFTLSLSLPLPPSLLLLALSLKSLPGSVFELLGSFPGAILQAYVNGLKASKRAQMSYLVFKVAVGKVCHDQHSIPPNQPQKREICFVGRTSGVEGFTIPPPLATHRRFKRNSA